MIDSNEIKIGNWFQHNEMWSYRTNADNIEKHFYFQWEDRDWYALGECTMSLDDCEPIPLTPDILEKCGFKQDEFDSYGQELKGWIFDNFRIIEYNNGYVYFIYNDDDTFYSGGLGVPFHSLHQLQNLYYSLTNTNLIINNI